jgi:DNA ligase (NAD+)
MDKLVAENRIKFLSDELNKHNHNYYLLDNPTISDFEFDKLLEELISLEKQFPEFYSTRSPSQRIGGGLTKEFKSVKHI